MVIFGIQAPVRADDATNAATTLDTVTVTAAKLRSLEQFTPTGSRLGLSAQELPATLEVIDNDEMLGRGFVNVQQAADSQAGVTSGGSPGDQSQFSMRGFTGNQITVLRNGLYIGPSNMTTRDQNAFNVGSVEILKGPASVLYGQGAVAGTVNVVDKAPSFGEPQVEALASGGSFGSTNVGLGGTTHFGDTLAIRADVSRTATQGYVAHDPSNTTEATVTALWKPAANLDVQLTIDWLEDNPSTYYGTPLVPTSFATQPLTGVISSSNGVALDRRMQFVNYNVSDASIHSAQYWPQLLLKWTPIENLTIQNFTYYFHARRRWQDAETYQFTTADLNGNPLPSPQINRDRFYVFHDQNLTGDEGSASYKGAVFGLPNTAVVGFDYSHLNFDRVRGFPDNDLVDPFNPSPGLFGPLLQPGERVPRDSPTRWNDYAAFMEDVVDLTPQIKLVTGLRYDRLELDRLNFNTQGVALANGFSQTYSSTNWRAGLVYNLNDYVTPYVSWTTGKDPPGSNNIFLVNAPEGTFALSSSHQIEFGVKARTPDNRADLTVALYDIKKSNLLVQTGEESQANASQSSKGIELTTNFKPIRDWTVSANASYTDSVYTAFTDPLSGSSYDDVQPANIPRWTANVWTSWRNIGGVPLELGGGVRYIGKRPGNTSNTLILDNYALFNAYASYEVRPGVLVTARGNNLSNETFVQWADIFYPSNLILGQPRYWELGVYLKL
jgi:iron complex outermembrane receptor protein